MWSRPLYYYHNLSYMSTSKRDTIFPPNIPNTIESHPKENLNGVTAERCPVERITSVASDVAPRDGREIRRK